ncbi:oxidoreductase [Legionella adelaidensis]|uniref:Oxidoreductase n=1 Tax=Legionella adelaidensis TaxID=45056 RepID=A0A0W0R4S7_9GAMM|nr:Gfo/Idh/MocA family oxidoreductase [Legionella adelaidensis]KTC66084.1 oxidoreductase [Legionella adelaidensis]
MKNIVVVGRGSIGKRHLSNVKKIFPQAKIWEISSREFSDIKNNEVNSRFEKIANFKADFAIVASPATMHFEHARDFIDSNVPTLIEKPVTATQKEAEALLELCQKSNVPVQIGYCLRYMPAAALVKRIIDNEDLGIIYNISVHAGQFLPFWRKDKNYLESVSASAALGGGALLELSHELDYLDWFFGELTLHHAILRNTKELNLEVEEIADITFSTTKGAIGTIHLNFIQKRAQRFCKILGEKGHLIWDLVENKVSLFTGEEEEIIYNQPQWDKNEMYTFMLNDFASRIKSPVKKDLSSVESALRTVKTIEEIKRKALWGTKQ